MKVNEKKLMDSRRAKPRWPNKSFTEQYFELAHVCPKKPRHRLASAQCFGADDNSSAEAENILTDQKLS